MISWNQPFQTAVYRSLHELVKFVPSHCVFCFLILVISSFVVMFLHSKVHQQKATKKIPTLSAFTYLRAMIAGRKRANVSFLELVFGVCSLFPNEGMYGILTGPVKYVFVYNLEAVEFVLGNRIHLRKGNEYRVFKPLLMDGCFMSSGRKWHTRRRLLTPSFHFRILDDFLPTINRQASIAVERIDELMGKEPSIDVVDIIGQCTLDTILETAVGVNANELGGQRKVFLEHLHKAAHITTKRIPLPWLWFDFIFYRTEEGKMVTKYTKAMMKFTREVIDKRKRAITGRLHGNKDNGVIQSNCYTSCETTQRLPLLDMLINLQLKDNTVSLEDMVEEVLTFIIGGHDTTAVAVSWTLCLLSLHPDIQSNVHQEVDAAFGDDIDRIVTGEDVKSLKYLHCALKEAMRLYPPGGIMSRTLDEDTIINGYEIKKDTSLVIPIYVLHRNPAIFPNPEEFIPDRFNEHNSKNIHPFAYIPFSAGPRNCIGQRFATYSAMTILTTVLRHYSVKPVEHRDKIDFEFNILTEPANGIHLKFTRRQCLKKYSL